MESSEGEVPSPLQEVTSIAQVRSGSDWKEKDDEQLHTRNGSHTVC